MLVLMCFNILLKQVIRPCKKIIPWYFEIRLSSEEIEWNIKGFIQ